MRIMTGGTTNKLRLYKKLKLSAVSMGVVVGPVVFGIFNAPQTRAQSPPANGSPSPSFEVASIQLNHAGSGMVSSLESPGRFTARRATGPNEADVAFAACRPIQIESEARDKESSSLCSGRREERTENSPDNNAPPDF